MAMDATSMKDRIKAAYAVRTGQALSNEGDVLIDICTGLIEEVAANAALKQAQLMQSLNALFSAGVPVPNDGGAALQQAWIAATAGGAYDGVSGGVE